MYRVYGIVDSLFIRFERRLGVMVVISPILIFGSWCRLLIDESFMCVQRVNIF